MVRLHVDPRVQNYRPSPAAWSAIVNRFRDVEGDVYLLPRSDADRALGRVSPPYAFRGFTRGSKSFLFADSTETPDSLAWLLAHELAHRLVDASPVLDQAFVEAKPKHLDPRSDAFHQVDAEERWCDGIATSLLGTTYDRSWWRARTPRSIQYGGLVVDFDPAGCSRCC